MKTNTHNYTLTISYWSEQEIIETCGTGKTKEQAKRNWLIQRYAGNPPRGACLPAKKDIINISLKKNK